MDLIERGLRPAANIVFNRYLIETQRVHDLDALTALPLFMSVRAAIRAKVTAARRKHSDARERLSRDARGYADLARELLKPAQPRLVAIGGLSGTGKSLLARTLAPEIMPMPGAVVLRSDLERKAMFGIAETEPLPKSAYAREVTAKVYATLAAKARRTVAAGHSAIVDAVFAQPEERADIVKVADAADFIGLFLTADLRSRLDRVGARTGDASDANAAIVQDQEKFKLGCINWARVDASGTPLETFIRARVALNLE
jgi:predicted kinase